MGCDSRAPQHVKIQTLKCVQCVILEKVTFLVLHFYSYVQNSKREMNDHQAQTRTDGIRSGLYTRQVAA